MVHFEQCREVFIIPRVIGTNHYITFAATENVKLHSQASEPRNSQVSSRTWRRWGLMPDDKGVRAEHGVGYFQNRRSYCRILPDGEKKEL